MDYLTEAVERIRHDDVVSAVVQATLGVALERALVELFNHIPLTDTWLDSFGSEMSTAIEQTNGINLDDRTLEDAKNEAMKRLLHHLDRVARQLANQD